MIPHNCISQKTGDQLAGRSQHLPGIGMCNISNLLHFVNNHFVKITLAQTFWKCMYTCDTIVHNLSLSKHFIYCNIKVLTDVIRHWAILIFIIYSDQPSIHDRISTSRMPFISFKSLEQTHQVTLHLLSCIISK